MSEKIFIQAMVIFLINRNLLKHSMKNCKLIRIYVAGP